MFKKKFHPSIRTLLLAANLVILAVPITALYLFRIYENELVKQTEMELISQAVLVGGIYKKEILYSGGENYGTPHWRAPKNNITSSYQKKDNFFSSTSPINPISPKLDLATAIIYDNTLSFTPSTREADPLAVEVAERITPILEESLGTILSRITILDPHGIVVSKARGQGLSMEKNLEVQKAIEGEYASILRTREVVGWTELSSASRGAKYRVFVALPVFNDNRLIGVIHLSRTPRELLKALYEERGNLLYVAGAAISLLILVSLFTSFQIIGPVKKLALEAREVAEGTKTELEESSKKLWEVKEVSELRDSVTLMSERLKKRSDYLKAYASGVSHEFKTPLSSIRGALELITDHGHVMEPEVLQKFQYNIGEDLGRLDRLVNSLLALARAEAVIPTGDTKTDLLVLLDSLSQRLTIKTNKDFTVDVITNILSQSLILNVEKDALETVLINLIENSREHSAKTVTIEVHEKDSYVHIEISDDGTGITLDDPEKIFQPFFTTRKKEGGTGLGLPLARTLLAPYQGELRFLHSPSTFEINIPLFKTNV